MDTVGRGAVPYAARHAILCDTSSAWMLVYVWYVCCLPDPYPCLQHGWRGCSLLAWSECTGAGSRRCTPTARMQECGPGGMVRLAGICGVVGLAEV